MGQLIVRHLDDALVRQLKMRAAEHGRSAEEEHRHILREVLGPATRTPLIDVLRRMPDVGEDTDFERDDDFGRELEW